MAPTLTELQRISTTGARAVESFRVGGRDLLAIPQLAIDVPGTPAGMNVGDSNTEMLLLERVGGAFSPFATLPAPGGEDAEFFTIGDRHFLAVACIRTGSGPYEYVTESFIYEWGLDGFERFQTVETFAAKQWKHWSIGDHHFLGLAQGLALPQFEGANRDSIIFEWDGERFVEFQMIASQWAYNWHPFEIDGRFFVAHADHVTDSVLYAWNGFRYVEWQTLLPHSGRAFAHFADDDHYLVVAGLADPPAVLRWNGERFVDHAALAGRGARELRVVQIDDRLLLIRVNFILGTPAAPQTALTSQVYEWIKGTFVTVAEFATTGGTDVDVLTTDAGLEFAVSNALTADVRFAAETVVYSLSVPTGGAR